jgi:hypothetical protein
MLRFAWASSSGDALYAVDHVIALIDNWVVVPAAWLSPLTGLLESWLTSWGFFKFRWVTVKWIATVAIMVYASIFQAPLDRNIQAISSVEGLAALYNPAYLYYRQLQTISGMVFIAILIVLSLILTLKPWLKDDRIKLNRGKSKDQLAEGAVG